MYRLKLFKDGKLFDVKDIPGTMFLDASKRALLREYLKQGHKDGCTGAGLYSVKGNREKYICGYVMDYDI